MTFKKLIKYLMPTPVLKSTQILLARLNKYQYKNLSTQKIFERIYEKGVWGKSKDLTEPFYSGSGSHDDVIVMTYVKVVKEFLSELDKKPNVVDLGCGDFFVGSKVRNLCDNYIACDIVPKLIEFNKIKFSALNIDFRVLDLTKDELPSADIVFIRQVLQHLSNEQILNALPQLCSKYKYIVLTEHLPNTINFQHNIDKPSGPDIRAGIKSGIVLTSFPFNIKPINEKKLYEFIEGDGLIVTTIYQFKA